MAWTKGRLLEQIYIAVSGGELSPAVEVDRADIESYLDAAVSYAIDQYQNQARQLSYRELRFIGRDVGGNVPLYESFTTTIHLTPVKDERSQEYYIDLPKGVSMLSDGSGLAEIGPVQGNEVYVRTNGRTSIAGMGNVGKITFYWMENQPDGKTRVMFRNLGQPVCDVYLRIMQDIYQLDMDDPLYIPASVQPVIIDMCTKYFLNQRGITADESLDQFDEEVNRRTSSATEE